MRIGSWVIVERATGEAVIEIFDRRLIDRLRKDRFNAVPIAEYLGRINAAIKNGDKG